MHEVTVTREVDAPVDRVWAAFDGFGGVYRFHPGVERSFATTEATSGLRPAGSVPAASATSTAGVRSARR
jgi:uncharacterized protein YndB with AHSA1/START domain